tara:strand:+ start:624 stop:1343 length:720 start_codon:yes stop_codon:yes gene_type:complete
MESVKPWSKYPINECGEVLKSLPLSIKRLEPHPYFILGAPYEKGMDPWRVRSGLIPLLLEAENRLQYYHPDFRLAIFDAWRPISVQSFMVEYTINQECQKRGISRCSSEDHLYKLDDVIKEVSMFWAEPSKDPSNPPPHSTGAAIDITLSYVSGPLVDMGGAIDEIGVISRPDYYKDKAKVDSKAMLWNSRRNLLAEILLKVGFVQHPNEWWHFSFGDQLWAWRMNNSSAIYGGVDFLC